MIRRIVTFYYKPDSQAVSGHPLKDWDIAKHPANTYINIRTNRYAAAAAAAI